MSGIVQDTLNKTKRVIRTTRNKAESTVDNLPLPHPARKIRRNTIGKIRPLK